MRFKILNLLYLLYLLYLLPVIYSEDDNNIDGIISPFFCSGLPFLTDQKICADEYYNFFGRLYTDYKVLGIGNNNGYGWLGGDSVGSVMLNDNLFLFVFGDSFISFIEANNIWEGKRNSNCFLPHNSISLLSISNINNITNQFFVGNNKKNLRNDYGIIDSEKCPFKYSSNKLFFMRNNPLYFYPIGCDSLIQPTVVNSESKHILSWLYGGIANNNDLALLAGNFDENMKNVGFEFIIINNALNDNSLNMNPFLWDKNSDRLKLETIDDILWEKVNKINGKEYLIYGGKNLYPGVEIYLIKGTYNEIINDTKKYWGGNKWKTNIRELKPIEINNNKIFGPNYYSEFDYDNENNLYFFYAIDIDNNSEYSIIKYNSDCITGPYDIDTNFTYYFPSWIKKRSTEISCYNLRSHTSLAKKLEKKVILSYVCQGIYPYYSSYYFDANLSSYFIYYPQFIIL